MTASLLNRPTNPGAPAPRARLAAALAEPVRPLFPLWLACLTALGAGIALKSGFPGQDVWPLTLLGVALMLISLIGRTWRSAVLVGLVGGLTFWCAHISWLTLYLGPVPWLALAIVEGVFFAIGAVAIAVVYRYADAIWPTRLGRLGVLPVVISGLWVAREAITAVAPEGGFSWGRVAFSQSTSPFASLVAWVGISGLSFLLVWLVAFVIQLVREGRAAVVGRATLAVAAAALLLVIPAWAAPTSGTTRIAAVQGNTKSGLLDRVVQGDNLNAHITETLKLEGQQVDMVVWPENASDIDPEASPVAAEDLDFISSIMKAPLVVGTIAERDGKYYNTSLLWENGSVADYYDKRHPVPFAEYMPARPLFYALAPALVSMVTRDYTPGTTSTVMNVNGVPAGISICFDITDDQAVQSMVDEGAQVILAQTNNADFGQTDENLQQLAIARLRAIETGRSVVNISTVGHSAIIAPDGSTIDSLTPYEPGAMVDNVPLSTTVTPASLFGKGVELLVSGLGVAGLVFALVAAARRRRRAR
ncbi:MULTISPECIES: apolipoprotein N-acyltransferase [Subtercola]|uniref:Apolipoprotein N-acyltransferase n=1 Tax=Subtercola vilae TaxID=2056433 RepID=A0A4T2C8V5_9MICO|nr:MULTISPECIES: apolipoprotein N-acyltransferase [Subtercola]MEA9983782.1 apolipoprotein N-acyltransferase [Subtercola sp. RTI3]TIH40677.1 apolipoprotein N-acyltransferase [Subtercola vilae]